MKAKVFNTKTNTFLLGKGHTLHFEVAETRKRAVRGTDYNYNASHDSIVTYVDMIPVETISNFERRGQQTGVCGVR